MQSKGIFCLTTIGLSLCLSTLTGAVESVVSTEFTEGIETEASHESGIKPVAFYSQSSRNPFWYAGVEALFMGIDADTGGRITMSFDDSTTAGTEISIADGQGLNNFGFAPRITLGRQLSDNWAVAGRYFTLASADSRFPHLAPGTTPLPTFGTYLSKDDARLYAIDLEAIRSAYVGKTKINASIGARHASVDVDSEVFAFGVITTGNFVNLNLSNGCAIRWNWSCRRSLVPSANS